MIWRCPFIHMSGGPPSVRSVVHNSCGQDIPSTMWSRILKISIYSSYGKGKKPINFQGQRSLGLYRLQTTIDFLIHLSYKTGHFGGLYKIP